MESLPFQTEPALLAYKPDHEHRYEPHPGWLVITQGKEPESTGTAQPLDAERCAVCGDIRWGSFTAPAQTD